MATELPHTICDLPVNYETLHHTKRKLVREEYARRQNGLCHYCGASLSGEPAATVLSQRVNESFFPPGFFSRPIHLHHDHSTGMTIGAVHARCNAVLWQYHGE
jgi:hypothetical protein